MLHSLAAAYQATAMYETPCGLDRNTQLNNSLQTEWCLKGNEDWRWCENRTCFLWPGGERELDPVGD